MTRKDIQDTARDTVKDVKQTGREAIAAANSGASEAASEAKAALRDEAETRAESGKDMAADRGQRLARDLRDAAGSQGEETFQGRLLETVASGVSDISDGLRDRSLSSILEQAERFARRNPGAFVAGAAIAGFALARFARASGKPREDDGGTTRETGNILAAEQRRVQSERPMPEVPS